MNKPLTHTFTFNPDDNGGESIFLQTTFHDANEGKFPNDVEPFVTQELTMNSYGSCATFSVSGIFTPTQLRKLADELDRSELGAIKELVKQAKAKLV